MDTNNSNEKDEFWNISALVPRKRRPTLESFIPSSSSMAREIVVDGANTTGEEIRGLHLPKCEVSRDVYTPSGNPLLLKVELEHRSGGYNFYRKFLSDAVALYTHEGTTCEYTPFFSYMPQYSQMTAAQLSYYLWWRSEVQNGRYPMCDEGYFYLFVYETLNLTPSVLIAKEALVLLCRVWGAYTSRIPKINKYMAEWVPDFCLLHHLPCPDRDLLPFIRAVLKETKFREFYLGALATHTSESVETLLALLSDYDWHASRYAVDETGNVYKEHLPRSLYPVFEHLFANGTLAVDQDSQKEVRHSAFCGALWAQDTRTDIILTYRPFGEAVSLRQSITAAVKYSENILRARLGLKSRLSVPPLDEYYCRLIDAYYRTMYQSSEQSDGKRVAKPSYDVLYDPPENGIDFSRADEIEELSWQNTRKLVPLESENGDETSTGDIAIKAPNVVELSPSIEHDITTREQNSDEMQILTEQEIDYLRCVVYGETVPVSYRPYIDEMAEKINETFINESSVGDIILENNGQGYSLIPDYSEEVQKWIKINGQM